MSFLCAANHPTVSRFFLVSFLFLLPLSYSLPLHAQQEETVSLTWGEEISQHELETYSMIGGDDTHFFSYKLKHTPAGSKEPPTSIVLYQLDQDLQVRKEKELAVTYQEQGRWIERICVFDSSLWVFFSTLDKEAGKSTLYLESIDPNTLVRTQAPRKLMSSKIDPQHPSKASFLFKWSPDGTRAGILCKSLQRLTLSRNDTLRKEFTYSLLLLDRKMEVTLDVILPNEIYDFSLNDEGGFAYIKLLPEGGTNGKASIRVVYGANREVELADYELKDLSILLPNIKLHFKSESVLLITGLSLDGGTFFYWWNVEGGNILLEQQTNFLKEFKNLHLSERENILPGFLLKKLLFKADGGVWLVGDTYGTSVREVHEGLASWSYTAGSFHTNMQRSVNNPSNSIYSGDILAINLDPFGEILAIKRIPMLQLRLETRSASFRQQFLSFSHMLSKDQELHLIFNDHEKNLSIGAGEKGKRFEPFRNMIVSLLTIQENGANSRRLLYKHQGSQSRWIPKSVVPINESEYLFFGKSNANLTFGKLRLE